MRLCFISNPNSTHTRRWVGWFAKRGHTVCLVADVALQESWTDVQVIDLSKGFHAPILRFPIWTLWLRRFLHQWQPDILHAHRVNSAGWLGAASGFHPLVVTPWGGDLNLLPRRSRLGRWLTTYVLKRADLVTADAMDLLQTAKKYGARPDCLHLVQWGVDLAHFHPDAINRNLQVELELGNGPIILCPRAIHPVYNLETIIRAMVGVRATRPEAILLLRDYSADPLYKRRLEDMIACLGLQEAVRWLGRVEPYERLAEVYRLADVVVSMAVSDSTPVSILEALACGIPVITSDLPALREWITPYENGLMVPSGDAESLASAIRQVLSNDELAERLAKAGPKLVAERANHQQEMERMEALYQSLL